MLYIIRLYKYAAKVVYFFDSCKSKGHFDTPYFRYFVTFYPNPTTQTILHA